MAQQADRMAAEATAELAKRASEGDDEETDDDEVTPTSPNDQPEPGRDDRTPSVGAAIDVSA